MNQSKALAILKSGKNVFLTGSAGAGKTFVLNQYIQYLKEHSIPVAVTASTGIAATHMNGQTIHSWSGIGIREELSLRHLNNLEKRKYFRDKIDAVKVLIVDEISMLHRTQLDLVSRVLKYFKKNEEAFGGIQVVFSGDFFQLPPIGKEWETSRDKFAFMSDAWLEAEMNICFLTEQHRQTNNDLNLILNEIRTGSVSSKSLDLLESRLEYHPSEDGEETKLFTHNADVDRINQIRLNQINKTPKLFTATTKGNPILVETLKKSVLAEEVLEFKVGAKVMFVRNNYEVGYVNGTLGVVTGFNDKNFPIIKTHDDKEIDAALETWAIEDETGKALASYTQLPLRLAWAISIHKSQGMTLDLAHIDLSKAFEKGQGYVALSRLKDLEGLKLYGLNEMALQIDDLAMRADKRFQVLSHQLDEEIQEQVLEASFRSFILHCGGTIDKKEIAKQKEKLTYKAKAEKVSTYQITKDYLEKGLSIDQIVKERGLGRGTILSHLIRISETDKEVDLSRFKPPTETIKKVERIYDSLKNKEGNLLKTLYSKLNAELTYDDIKLALMFVNK